MNHNLNNITGDVSAAVEIHSVKQYDEHVKDLLWELTNLDPNATRNDQGTRKLGCTAVSFNLLSMYPSIPASTLRHLPPESSMAEMIGFIRGETNVFAFQELGTKVWNANAANPAWKSNALAPKVGDLGPIYGKQWRNWEDIKLITEQAWIADLRLLQNIGYVKIAETNTVPKKVVIRRSIDQFRVAYDRLTANRGDRRAVITAWNPGDLDFMALPPCHILMQFTTIPFSQHAAVTSSQGISNYDVDLESMDKTDFPDQVLNLVVYMRSQDTLLGRQANIPAYAMLLRIWASITGMAPGNLEFIVADQHLYANHVPAAEEIQSRQSLDEDEEGEQFFTLDTTHLTSFKQLDTLTLADIKIENQCFHPKLESNTKMTV